jgi:hypothetical protein
MSSNLETMSLEQLLDLYYALTRNKTVKQYDIITLLSQEIVRRVDNKEYTVSMPPH